MNAVSLKKSNGLGLRGSVRRSLGVVLAQPSLAPGDPPADKTVGKAKITGGARSRGPRGRTGDVPGPL